MENYDTDLEGNLHVKCTFHFCQNTNTLNKH